MEEASISDSPSALSRRLTDLTSSGNGTAANCDHPSFEVEISTPLSPIEKPLPSSGEIAEIIADSETNCAVLGEDMQETLNGASNGKPEEESFGSDLQQLSAPLSPIEKPLLWSGESAEVIAGNLSPADSETICVVLGEVMREIKVGDKIDGAANGKPKEKSSDSGVQVTQIDLDSGGSTGFGKLSNKIDAVGGGFGCSLEIELIDDTAVIGLPEIGMDHLDTAGRKNGKKELEAKKDKKPRRRSKAARKGSGETKNSSNLKVSTGNSTGYKRAEKGAKIVYSTSEMETLRYRNVKGQQKLWQEVYNTLSPPVRTEYVELGGFRHQNNQSGLTWDTNRAPGVLGELCKRTVEGDLETPTPVECTYDDSYNGEDDKYPCNEYVEDEDSDDSFSIQRPAFYVEGEPDFDAGPPEDGIEYLRRVRWEAAQIPKVKVAKLDKSKLKKEQSVYMPEIPEIERCPEHLLPLKQWEEEFLSDFSELRLAVSRLDCSDNLGPVMIQSASNPAPTVEANGLSSLESTRPDAPTLSAILKMDLVARVCMLKRRILLFESKVELSRNDGLWLFALCAAIDTPLDADTSAVLRGLLRKCSKLRAGKSELDDEAIMLNILVLISGKYFGQAENST